MMECLQLPSRAIHPNNAKYDWLEKNYTGFLHTIFMQGVQAGVYEMNKVYPFGFKTGYSFNGTTETGELEIDWFWDARELRRVRNLFLHRAKDGLGFFGMIYRRWQRDHQRNIALYQRCQDIDVATLPDARLYVLYERLYRANVRQGISGYLADSFLTSGEEDWLSAFIKDRTTADSEAIAALTAPTILSYTNEQQRDLVILAQTLPTNVRTFRQLTEYLKKNKRFFTAIDRHARFYYWIENNYFSKVLTVKDFIQRLAEILNNGPLTYLTQTVYSNATSKKALLKALRDPWLSNVIAMSDLMTHVQDYRKMALVRLSYFFDIIFKEMARRRGMKLIHLYNVIGPEMESVFIKQKIDLDRLEQRARRNFCYGSQKGYRVYEGADYDRYVSKRSFLNIPSGIRLVHGVPAYGGLVRGRARIIKNAHHAGDLSKNDILITNNTTPEFVPLMKRVGAVVTEQGGITTHAAIVSRELKIPCVIGTRIATKVLSNGDRVEVNADTGIITILSREKR